MFFLLGLVIAHLSLSLSLSPSPSLSVKETWLVLRFSVFIRMHFVFDFEATAANSPIKEGLADQILLLLCYCCCVLGQSLHSILASNECKWVFSMQAIWEPRGAWFRSFFQSHFFMLLTLCFDMSLCCFFNIGVVCVLHQSVTWTARCCVFMQTKQQGSQTTATRELKCFLFCHSNDRTIANVGPYRIEQMRLRRSNPCHHPLSVA